MITDADYETHLSSTVAEGFVLNPPGFERLSRWTHILLHLNHARALFSALAESPQRGSEMADHVAEQGCFVAAIMAYGRCYSESGAGIPSLDAKQVHAGSEEAKVVHRRLMDLRNKFAAHTDHVDLIRLTLAVREEPDQMLLRHMATIVLPMNEVPGFIAAVERTERSVTLSLNKQLDHLEGRFGKRIVLD